MAAVSAEDDCSNTTTGADVTSSILTKDSAPAAANSNARIELDEEEEEPSSTCIEEIHGDDDVFLTPSESPFPPESVNTVIPSPLDPLAESYRVSTCKPFDLRPNTARSCYTHFRRISCEKFRSSFEMLKI